MADETRSTKTVFRTGDLLYGKLRPYLNKVAIPDFDGICSTDILVFPQSRYFRTRFLLYRLMSDDFVAYANLHTSGVQHPRVHYEDMAVFPILFPPLREQHRIVEAIEAQFSRLDAAVAALKRAQANLERYKASVLQAACEGRLVPTEDELARQEGRDYEHASVLLQRILAERRRKWEEAEWARLVEQAKKKVAQERRKAAGRPARLSDLAEEEWRELPGAEYAGYLPKGDRWKAKYEEPVGPDTEGLPALPAGWVWTTVEQVGEVIGGLTKNQKRADYPLQLPYLRVANVYADELRLDEVEIIGVQETELARTLLTQDDLLVVEGNGSIDQIGRVAVWDGSIGTCVHQNHIIKVRLVHPEMSRYALWWLLSPRGRREIVRVASSTSGLYTLSLSKVAVLPVPLAPQAEQRRIVDGIDFIMSLCRALANAGRDNSIRADRLRQSILKRAFEGRLVPQDPDDEPASVLLARIRGEAEAEVTPTQDRLPGV